MIKEIVECKEREADITQVLYITQSAVCQEELFRATSFNGVINRMFPVESEAE